jgi:hypothetical protein
VKIPGEKRKNSPEIIIIFEDTFSAKIFCQYKMGSLILFAPLLRRMETAVWNTIAEAPYRTSHFWLWCNRGYFRDSDRLIRSFYIAILYKLTLTCCSKNFRYTLST